MVTQEQLEVVTLPPAAWPAFKEARLKALSEDPQAFRRTYAEAVALPDAWWQERLQAVEDRREWLFFARVGGEIVGMMGAYRSDPVGTPAIWGVHVACSRRGQGIGAMLMARTLDELRQAGVGRVTLTVKKEQAAAVELYKKFGLVIMGDGRDQGEYAMERHL